MTEIEYNQKSDALKKKYHEDLTKLKIEYALSNKRASIGDFVTDGRGIILVDKIDVSQGLNSVPYTVYHGIMHTKKMEPFKSGERGFACDGDQLVVVKHGEQQK